MTNPIQNRKSDHLDLCANDDVGFRGTSTLLDNVRLVHDALSDLDEREIDLTCTLFGKTLRAPFLIAAMTGGTDEAGRINRELASIAEERGYAFGLGSQRAMHVRSEARDSYRVRDVAALAPLLGNLGIVQARELTTSQVQSLVDQVGADALCIHLNPAMELVQAGGDRDFRGGLSTLQRLNAELSVPVIVKETGCGLSASVAARLKAIGIRHVDVSGAGGTSWVAVETKRAIAQSDEIATSLGNALWDWGIPTAASIALLRPYGFDTLIGTGGIGTGVDVARAIALGAHVAGVARPALKALYVDGRSGAVKCFEQMERELRAIMLLTGCKNLSELRTVPRVVVGELRHWIDAFAKPSTVRPKLQPD